MICIISTIIFLVSAVIELNNNLNEKKEKKKEIGKKLEHIGSRKHIIQN